VALAEEFRHLLEQAVARTLPDTPFGVCLSGGLDSGAVWALVSHLASQGDTRAVQGLPISRTYPGMPCDESHLIHVMRTATGARDFIEIPVTQVNSVQWFEDNLRRVDGYYGVTGDTIPMLSQTLARDGRRVLLTGFGEEWISGSFRYLADDLLGLRWASVLHDFWQADPYRPSDSPRLRRLWQQSGLAGLARRMRWLRGEGLSPFAYDPALIPAPELPADSSAASGWPLARKNLLHSLSAARSTLIYENNEQLAAHFGVEIRQPLHDVDLIDFAFRLPPRCFTEGLREKQLLRRALVDLLPRPHMDLRFKASHIDRLTLLYPVFLRYGDPSRWYLVRQGFLREASLRDALRGLERAAADPAFPSTGPFDRRLLLTINAGWGTLKYLTETGA
jgi:asparagine synthase (glutamine-hydrolysing)